MSNYKQNLIDDKRKGDNVYLGIKRNIKAVYRSKTKA